MIYLTENIPNKITGITSLFLSSDTFIPNLSKVISEECEFYKYDKKTTTWELPIKNIHKLIDRLVEIENVTITSFNEIINNVETFDDSKYQYKPFEYQRVGIEYGLQHNKWLLLDDMGLGKTLQMIYLANELKNKRGIEHCMIICGVDSLRTNWVKEINKFTNLSSIILGNRVNSKGKVVYDSVIKRAEQLQNEINEFFIITTVTTFRSDDVVNAFLTSKNKIDMIVIDEGHKIKDINSIGGKNLLKLNAPYKVFLTGSLIVNDPLDCYAGLKWTENEHSSLTDFKKFYCSFNNYLKQYDGYKNIDYLVEELNNCSLRRTKDDVLDLPPKTIISEFVDMYDDHTKLYNEVVNGIKTDIDLVNLNTRNLLGLIVRLRQATSCPQILSSLKVKSSKIERCIELINELLSKNEKVVVFSGFKEVIYDLQDKLTNLNPLVITGDTNNDLTSMYVDKFQNGDEKLLFATYQKLGTGVTLNSARYMIFVDTPWTSSDFIQACDRIYRIGSEKPVFIYNLICVDTIDERVNQLVNDKKILSEFMIDNKVENENALQSLQKYILDL